MAPPSDDIPSQIADLKAEFQHVADNHYWVCLVIQPLGSDFGPPRIGELSWPSLPPSDRELGLPKILDAHGRPLRPSGARIAKSLKQWDDKLKEYGPLGPPGARTPENPGLRAVVEHVYALTFKAQQLLMRVLEGQNSIPADIRGEIKNWDLKCLGYGWVRWLWYAVPCRHRYKNYPQFAATALFELQSYIGTGLKGMRKKTTSGRRRIEDKDTIKFQIYDRICKVHVPHEAYTDTIKHLKDNKDFVEQIGETGVKLNSRLIRNALAWKQQRGRDQARKKQETVRS